MPTIPFQPPPGFLYDDTSFSSPARYKTGSCVRFVNGQWQVIGGWEALATTTLTGVCRNVYPWNDNNGYLNIAFGTHSALQIWQGGTLYTNTPTLNYPKATLGANPLATTNASATVVVTQAGHPYATGQSVIVAGATAVGGITPNGTFTITATTTDTWSFTFGSAATSTATGGGSAVTVTPQYAFQPGQIDGTGGAGYGTGSYGVGAYGSPSTTEYFPRTWSLSAYGEYLIANPRDGAIFWWQNNTGAVATPIDNSPAKVTYALAMPQRQIMAFGCSEETSGVYNHLCIRWSDIEGPTTWTTSSSNNAGEYIIEGGGRIVSAMLVGEFVLVWTSSGLHLGTFLGNPGETWRFQRQGDNCGLIGPNAVCVVGQTAYWISPDAQFWTYALGGQPQQIPSTVRKDFADNLALGQFDKIVASSISQWREVKWFYPDQRDGIENSRYVTLSLDGSWDHGQLARTAFCDAGTASSPIGATYAGAAYWHERGNSADGAALEWFIESTDFYADESQNEVKIGSMWPNFMGQIGAVYLTMYTKHFPQDVEYTHGPYTLSPGKNQKSFRCTGRVTRLKFSGNSSPSYARMGKCEFDVDIVGGR